MNDIFKFILMNGLTPNSFFVLYCIKEKIQSPLKNTAGELLILQSEGWLSLKMGLTQKATDLLSNANLLFSEKKKEVAAGALGPDAEQWIEAYRMLFPPGKPAKHGKLVRTTALELESRFIWFFKNYPHFNWNMVIAATQYYIQDQAMENNTYMKQAKYFIQKQEKDQPGVFTSELATYCDDLEIKDQAA